VRFSAAEDNIVPASLSKGKARFDNKTISVFPVRPESFRPEKIACDELMNSVEIPLTLPASVGKVKVAYRSSPLRCNDCRSVGHGFRGATMSLPNAVVASMAGVIYLGQPLGCGSGCGCGSGGGAGTGGAGGGSGWSGDWWGGFVTKGGSSGGGGGCGCGG